MFGLQTVGDVIVNALNYFLWEKSYVLLFFIFSFPNVNPVNVRQVLEFAWVSSWDTPQGGDLGASHQCRRGCSSFTSSSCSASQSCQKL